MNVDEAINAAKEWGKLGTHQGPWVNVCLTLASEVETLRMQLALHQGPEVDQTVARNWFDKVWAYYQHITPSDRQKTIPASSKADCWRKFSKICRTGESGVTTSQARTASRASKACVDPEALALSIELYVNDTLEKGNFICSLATVIGTMRPFYLDYIDAAKRNLEAERDEK